jgi:hypothetical protein
MTQRLNQRARTGLALALAEIFHHPIFGSSIPNSSASCRQGSSALRRE